MKKILLLAMLITSGCATKKAEVSNYEELTAHHSPYKVFGIGHYGSSYNILTLVDAQNKYFTIKAPRNTALKIGDTYTAE